jgi:hypothetical protein
MAPRLPLTGGCLCGSVRFELGVAPERAGYCHCTRCQRRTGTASSVQTLVDGSALTITRGEELVGSWTAPAGGMEKCFCRGCGAHLFSRDPSSGVFISVRMSAYDADPGVRPSFRQHLASAVPWEPVPDDGLERFAGQR